MKAKRSVPGLVLLVLYVPGCTDRLPGPKGSEAGHTPPQRETHGIAVTGVSAPTSCVQGDTIRVVAHVENRGNLRESVQVVLTDVTAGRQIGRKALVLSATGQGDMRDVADLALTGENPGDRFGVHNFTGDINEDGYDDLVAAASGHDNYRGRIYVYYGGVGGLREIPDLTLTGANPGDHFGLVRGIGDVNADGYHDLVVGALGYDNGRGRVYIFHGGPNMDQGADMVLDGVAQKGRFGRSIAVGDVNGDGYQDVFVAADYYNNLTGRVYLYYGGDPMDTTPGKVFDGQQEGELFGRCLCHQNKIADVDGDGYGDVLISSRNWNQTQGRAYLYYGGPGRSMNTTPGAVFTGEFLGDDFGVSGVLFDINHDGYADILIGARKWPGGAMQGRVYLYWGRDRTKSYDAPDFVLTGEADASATFGDGMAVGYVNDDKYADIIVPAYDYYRLCQHGRTYLFYGGPKSSIDNVFDRAFAQEGPGNLIANAVTGDFNGDKCQDLVTGGWGYPNWAERGRVWIYYGRPPSSTHVMFDWDTTDARPGDHVLNAKVSGLASTEDVTRSGKTIIVSVEPAAASRRGNASREDLGEGSHKSATSQEAATAPIEKPTRSLTLAAVEGDIAQVKSHLAFGADIDEEMISGDTALHYAIKYQHPEVVELLVAKGADVNRHNRDGETPAHLAIKTHQPAILDLLITKGVTVSPVHLAAYRGDQSAVERSLKEATPVNIADEGGLTLLHAAASGGRKEAAEYLIRRGAGVNVYDKKKQTPLFCAAAAGHADMVEFLVEKGADVNPPRKPDCWTPLYAAVSAGHKDVVALLTSRGGDVNAKAVTGDTPLHVAALRGDRAMAAILIENGAKLNTTNARWGNTPLHVAVAAGRDSIVELLAAKGADLNVKNSEGFVPLHYAVTKRRLSFWETQIGDSSTPNDLAITQLLLMHGADVNAKSNDGATPLSLARKWGQAEIVELLRQHGAKE